MRRTLLGSRLVINDEDVPRELSGLVVPLLGSLETTGDLFAPYRLVNDDGATVEPVAAFFAELAACGRPVATQRSYGMDLLRWFRFLWALGVDWDQATRVEARDFCRWLQVTVKPMRPHWRYPGGGAPGSDTKPAAGRANAVTGKPSRGDRYEAATVAHCESVLRGFYDFHLEAGHGSDAQPVPAVSGSSCWAGAVASQSDGAVRWAAQRPVPAHGGGPCAAEDPGRAVRRVVRAAGFAS